MLSLPFAVTGTGLRISRLCTITRKDGVVVRIIEAQVPYTISGNTWVPDAGVTISATKHAMGASSSVQIDAFTTPGATFDLYDVANRKFDFASVRIEALNRSSPTATGLLFSGNISTTTFNTSNSVSFNCLGPSEKGKNPFGQVYGAMCRTDLGSVLCKIPLLPGDVARLATYALSDTTRVRFASAGDPSDYSNRYLEATGISTGITASSAPSWSSTVGAVITDGGVTWTVRNAWTRYAKVASVTGNFIVTLDRDVDARAIDGWFNNGAFRMADGYSAGEGFEVGAWTQSTRQLTTFLPFGAANNSNLFAVGDWLEIWPGCDHTVSGTNGCIKFANTLNFQGEPYYLGVVNASSGGG